MFYLFWFCNLKHLAFTSTFLVHQIYVFLLSLHEFRIQRNFFCCLLQPWLVCFGVLVSSIQIVSSSRFTNLLFAFLVAFLAIAFTILLVFCCIKLNATKQSKKSLKTRKESFVFKNSAKSFSFWVSNCIFHNFGHSFQFN